MSTGQDADDDNGWNATRRRVLDRDGHACRFCGTTNDEHREEHGRGLHAHHIIPEGDGGRDAPENLITVCCRCHRTLEETHGRAVAQMKHREDYADDLEGLTWVWRQYFDTVDDLDIVLGEFADGHPTFADEFDIHTLRDGTVVARGMEDATAFDGPPQIDSEWAFAVAWGYREGVLDVATEIDGKTGVPFDDDSAP